MQRLSGHYQLRIDIFRGFLVGHFDFPGTFEQVARTDLRSASNFSAVCTGRVKTTVHFFPPKAWSASLATAKDDLSPFP